MRYKPHDYQAYAIDYIETHPVATVFLDMGLGKTSITLTAINDLLFDSFEVHRVLVIAPLRVARDTWTAEVDKWDHLHKKLTLTVYHIRLPQNQFLNQFMAIRCRHSNIGIYRLQGHRADIIDMPFPSAFIITGEGQNPDIVTVCGQFIA